MVLGEQPRAARWARNRAATGTGVPEPSTTSIVRLLPAASDRLTPTMAHLRANGAALPGYHGGGRRNAACPHNREPRVRPVPSPGLSLRATHQGPERAQA